jgi:hypothetical protein
MSKQLVRALKAKFGTPRNAMARLGLDMALLRDADPSMRSELETSERRGRFDPRGNTSGTIEGGPERRGEDRDPPIEPPSPEQNRGEDWQMMADDDEMFDPLRDHLRQHGMDDEEVEQAIDVARRHVARDRARRSNGKDRLPQRVDVQDRSDDKMPLRGGRFDRARFSRDEDPNEMSQIIDHGLDQAHDARLRRRLDDPSKREIRQIHKLMERFGSEVGTNPERYRGAQDGAPMTERQKVELFKFIPGLDLIGDPSADGPGVRDHKNRFEV